MKTNKLIILTLLIVLSAAGTAFAEGRCFKCHEKAKFVDKVVHEPVASGECVTCHNPHVAKYKNLLQKEVKALCYACHEPISKGHDSGRIHKPVRDGNCLACHDPHAAKFKGLLRENQRGESCYSCHDKLAKKFKVTHSPFAKGLCTACHYPHESDNIQLLKMKGDQLCRSCHKGDLGVKHKKFPSAPAACLTCHNPHGSDRAALIRNMLHPPFEEGCGDCHDGEKPVGSEVCVECHSEVSEQMKATHAHLTSSSGNSCMNCHSPHAADTSKLFRNRQSQVCRSCHANTYATYIDAEHKHPDTNSCGDCHEVHGSKNLVMLRGDGIEVCSGCHKTQGQFTHPVGEGVLDPRTLREITCVSCHYPHGTEFIYNLKDDPSKALCVRCHQGY